MPSFVLFWSDSSYQVLVSVVIHWIRTVIFEHMLISITMVSLFPFPLEGIYILFVYKYIQQL